MDYVSHPAFALIMKQFAILNHIKSRSNLLNGSQSGTNAAKPPVFDSPGRNKWAKWQFGGEYSIYARRANAKILGW